MCSLVYHDDDVYTMRDNEVRDSSVSDVSRVG